MDKLPEIFGFKAEVPLADGIGGEGVELFDPRADDEFRERARLVQRLRSELGLAVFMINCGVFFGNQAVKDTVMPGNVWDFHGGEMETSMILAERPELVKMETAQAGIPRKFMGNRSLTVYGPITLGWVSEEWETEDGTPIGIGGDPRGATAEKGEQIYQSFVGSIVDGLKEIRRWKDQ